jgi:hydroxyacylglutathione hydrolase
MIGLDRVGGCFRASVVQEWIQENRGGQGVPEVSADQLVSLLATDAVELIDVRNSSEWEAGHIPGSRNLPLGRLPELLEHISRDKPLVVHCQSGGRAGVAIGLLQAKGFRNVSHLTGDFAGWSSP